MSLIHWWPLNGNTKDYGLHSADLTNNNATINNNGKIGKTYRYNGGVMVTNNNDLTSNTTNMTIAGWVYLNSGNYAYVFSCRQGTGGPGLFISLETSCSIFDDGTRWRATYCIPLNTWVHFAFTRDSTSKKLYINGVLHSQTSTLGNLGSIHNKMYIGRNYYNDTASTSSDVMINDFRIYDHALSQKEVKEISKGLVLHYTFEDEYIETTTNLSNANWSAYNSYFTIQSQTANEITLVSQGTTHGVVALQNSSVKSQLTANTTITISGYLYKDGVPYKTTVTYPTSYNSWTNISRESRDDGYFRLTGKFGNLDSGWLFHVALFGSPASGIVCKIKNLQWEIKDHATPYVNGTRSAGKVYDSSGYGYNGTPYGDLQISSDSGSGQYSAKFNGVDTAVQTPNLAAMVPEGVFTISGWFKHIDEWSSKNWETLYGGPSGFEIEAKLGSTNSPMFVAYNWGGNSSADQRYAYTLNVWHQFVMVRNSSGTTWYMDGVQVFTGTAGSVPSNNYFIGAWNSATQQNFKGQIADFKIYATALSASDILAEYQRKAAIDRNGNLFTGEFVETNNNLLELANYKVATQGSFDGYLQAGSAKKTYYDANFPNKNLAGVGRYTQSNLSVTMTENGVRIYSAPNLVYPDAGNTMWGGLGLSPMKTSNCLIKGHRYIISWHVSGQSSRAMSDVYWTNQIGWGQSPDASPTVNASKLQPANFQGEMDCYYDFTINDDIWKTTGATTHSGFDPNTTYLAYAGFKIGYGYASTGTLGTDIYITNIQMIDVTDNILYKITKNGLVKTTQLNTGNTTIAKIKKNGNAKVNDAYEL